MSRSLPPTLGSDPLDGDGGDGADNPEEEEGEGEEEHVAPQRGEHLVGVHRRLGPLRTHPLCVQHGEHSGLVHLGQVVVEHLPKLCPTRSTSVSEYMWSILKLKR